MPGKPNTPRAAHATRRLVYRPRRYDLAGLADPFDATVAIEPAAPEPVFDRVTGPFACDEDV